jgi:lipopolysaccharide/colanic/teichoic acid biosynthesis glycosyltransferase
VRFNYRSTWRRQPAIDPVNNVPIRIGLSHTSLQPSGWGGHLSRLRYQLLLGLFVTVFLPSVLYYGGDIARALAEQSSINTALGSGFAYVASLFLFRRGATFPGFGLLSYLLPAVGAGYGSILAVFFAARLDYSRLTFGMSLVGAIAFLFLITISLRRQSQHHFYLVPFGHCSALTQIPGTDWKILNEPRLPDDPRMIVIADLRAELGHAWERLIADAVLAGYPVYHSKHVQESLTGRVQIEHLSENNFGSLVPNLSYYKIKRVLDLALVILLLPLMVLLIAVVALFIKLDSPGPIFFRQARCGYRGQLLWVLKFRTMVHRADNGTTRDSAMTQTSDARITRVGRILRRTRVDELPQIWNIIRGEMSWIGPRPEALTLSEWYAGELPFYSYRHIVRPGITGWAQVNQGHVADLESVSNKLQYDFFYIKNYSAWLDLLILYRTLAIVWSGFGSK